MTRPVATAVATISLLLAALPFVTLFPSPPRFGPEALTLIITFGIVATLATAWRAEEARRCRVLYGALVLLATTVAAAATSMVLHGLIPVIPTADVLPRLFALEGEEIDAAVQFEAWTEVWLLWALLLGIPAALLFRRAAPPPILPSPWYSPARPTPWNAATVLLFAVGWGAMAATVVEGHRTAAFLARADHAEGTIANDDAHPLIRFSTADGTIVTFRQNGDISRPVGAAVPVAYDPADPAGTAAADTFFATWSNTAGLAWLGLGFTLFPFFGIRAAFGRR